tara:strand:- start:218 stop:400 length:183 start_codon:yes stop_codon:yes gene_type:complete
VLGALLGATNVLVAPELPGVPDAVHPLVYCVPALEDTTVTVCVVVDAEETLIDPPIPSWF